MVCLAAAVSLLAIWSALRARWNTSTDSPTAAKTYNSSQNAVLAIWLIANTWFINVLRAKIVSFYIPSILYTIVISVACTFSQRYTLLAQAERLARELLVSMLSGLAISAAVGLVIVPITSRKIAIAQQKRIIGLLQQAMRVQKAYLSSIDHAEQHPHETATSGQKTENKSARADSLKTNSDAILQLAAELRTETAFAQWDMAIGKLSGEDFEKIFKVIQAIVIPMYASPCEFLSSGLTFLVLA